MSNNLAYVYKWTHTPTMKWYVGSRTAKNANPLDGYICSSKVVKALILADTTDWTREIIATGTSADMYDLETTILQLFDAKNDLTSFNQGNNNGTFSTAGISMPIAQKKKISNKLLGKVVAQVTKDIMSANRKGVVKSAEHRHKIALAKVGKPAWPKGKKRSPRTDEHKARATASRMVATEKRKLAKSLGLANLSHLSNTMAELVQPIKELKK